jgi:hypothetical protein
VSDEQKPRRRGRRKKDDSERLENCTVRLAPELQDEACRIALQRDVPVAEVIREWIDRGRRRINAIEKSTVTRAGRY